jgi:hypothetical protein
MNEMKKGVSIVISDAICHDCNGAVTLFGIPDKVWKGLGFTTEWVCISCVMHRLNPAFSSAATADDLSEEIHRQRSRFKLKRINRICGQRAPVYVVVLHTEDESGSSWTKKEVMEDRIH